jgi:hypothetical protein
MTEREGVEPAEVEARRALDAYPDLVWAGVVFTCLERVGHRWRVLESGLDSPQEARDHLAHIFLVEAKQSLDAAEYRAAAELLDWERHDELTVAGRFFRIGRIERSVRMGPDGPEPPRPTDPDGEPGERPPRRSLGFIDANALTGTAAAVLRYQLHNRYPDSATGAAREDARRAIDTHPRLVLLPAEFAVAEEIEGRWRPRFNHSEPTPQAARDWLTGYLRPTRIECPWPDPAMQERYAQMQALIDSNRPSPQICAEWERAADLIDRDRLDDVHVAGYHFRVMRVDQVLRTGQNGPEPPRPSDPDPYDPSAVTAQAADDDLED